MILDLSIPNPHTALYTSSEHSHPDFDQRRARTFLRDLVSSVLLAELNTPTTCIELLTDVQAQCKSAGVPFSWLLEQPMEGVGEGITPLTWEIMRCDMEGPELVIFLLENMGGGGVGGDLEWMVRKACLRREWDANAMFQTLLKQIAFKESLTAKEDSEPEPITLRSMDYEVVPNEVQDGNWTGFNVVLSIFDFEQSLRRVQASKERKRQFKIHKEPPRYATYPVPSPILTTPSSSSSSSSPSLSSGPSATTPRDDPEPYVSIQFIVSERAWSIDVGHNALKLSLLDGRATAVDARAILVASPSFTSPSSEPAPSPPEPSSSSSLLRSEAPSMSASNSSNVSPPFEFLFPRSILHPLSSSGQHTLSISPCFSEAPGFKSSFPSYTPRGFDDPCILHDGDELLLQLSVKLESIPIPGLGQGISSALASLLSEEQEEQEMPPMRVVEDDWEMLDQGRVQGQGAAPSTPVSGSIAVPMSDENGEAVTGAGWVKASWSGRDEDL